MLKCAAIEYPSIQYTIFGGSGVFRHLYRSVVIFRWPPTPTPLNTFNPRKNDNYPLAEFYHNNKPFLQTNQLPPIPDLPPEIDQELFTDDDSL